MPDQNGKVPPHFIVIVPGFMGSLLRDKNTGTIEWIDFGSIPLNPLRWGDWLDHLVDTLRYPNDKLEPAGIVKDVIFVPPWAKQEQYSRLIEFLENIGYNADPEQHAEADLDVYSFPYDWRGDNRTAGRQLAEAIDGWRAHHPDAEVWIIAHSNGGLVSRWYVEQEGGAEHVGRLFLLGSPWDGTPKAMRMLFGGLDMLFRRRFNLFNLPERSRAVIRSFPSIYQLMPFENPFLRGLDNEPINPFEDTSWLDDEQHREFLADGLRFSQELGTTLSVETLCFFGRKRPTQTFGVLRKAAGGRWSDIEWHATEAGDGTIPERSAVHPEADAKYPAVVGHGDIYVNPGVQEILEWELAGKYQDVERAIVVTERLSVVFEPDRDVYAPGETVNLWATVHDVSDAEGEEAPPPISDARIQVQLAWRQPLPGDTDVAAPADLPATQLDEDAATPGRYAGSFRAPDTEGYYELKAVVVAGGEAPVVLEELVAVEAEPDA